MKIVNGGLQHIATRTKSREYTFSKILIFFNARILWVGIWIALCTTLLAPLPIAPNTLISWEPHLYVFSLWSLLSSTDRDVHFCNPSSLILYTPYDLLNKFTVPPSDSFSIELNQPKKKNNQKFHIWQNHLYLFFSQYFVTFLWDIEKKGEGGLLCKNHKGPRLNLMRNPCQHQTKVQAFFSIPPTQPLLRVFYIKKTEWVSKKRNKHRDPC